MRLPAVYYYLTVETSESETCLVHSFYLRSTGKSAVGKAEDPGIFDVRIRGPFPPRHYTVRNAGLCFVCEDKSRL